jgi:hypothetical protein
MNDELTGQLCAGWKIPEFARDALWLETESEIIPCEGESGLFTLNEPASVLTVRWCGAKGPALARLPWQPDNLGWSGRIGFGGYVDALHVTEIPGLPYSVMVIYVGGQPLKSTTMGYPNSAVRYQPPYPAPDFYSGLAADVTESITTWLVPDESPMALMSKDAIMNNLRLHFFGQIADDASGFSAHFALPLLLQAITLFGP